MQTHHASIRAQQRGIPPLIDELLDRYGDEQYDGHGAIIVYLSKRSRRRMQKDMGREPVARLASWLDAYKVKRVADGLTLTTGHRYQRLWRR